MQVFRYIRYLFPYFYSIGLHNCDTGGRVFAWYPEWGINYWHVSKRLERWNDTGDGETYTQISMVSFFKWKYDLWKSDKSNTRNE